MSKLSITIAGVLSLLLSGSLLAHGTDHDDETESTDAVILEQMPWGIGADASEAIRTIHVSMADAMRFSPGELNIKLGETVRFVISNEGELMHEFVLGTRQTNDEHAELMLKFPNMEHDEPYMAHVPPGGTGEIVWTFNRAGTFNFACLIAGHYQSGMVGSVIVEPV